MSEEAIKRSYFKEDDQDKPKQVLDCLKNEAATNVSKVALDDEAKEKMVEEPIGLEKIENIVIVQPLELSAILEYARKSPFNQKEDKKGPIKSLSKVAQTKKTQKSASPQKIGEQNIKTSKAEANKSKQDDSAQKEKSKPLSKPSKKPETKPKPPAEPVNSIKQKLEKGKVKVEHQDTILASEIITATKANKKSVKAKVEDQTKSAPQAKVLQSKVQSKRNSFRKNRKS